MKPLLIVDGYNVIGAWPEAMRQNWSLDASRDQLAHLLQDYAGYSGQQIVLVFDGYQSDRTTETEEQQGPILTVFTKHGETADSYIERYVAQVPRYRQVRVATSDGLEQSQVLSTGAVRLTSRELLRELKQLRQQGMEIHQRSAGNHSSRVEDHLPQKTLEALELLRRADIREEVPEKTKLAKSPEKQNQRKYPAGTGVKETHGRAGNGVYGRGIENHGGSQARPCTPKRTGKRS